MRIKKLSWMVFLTVFAAAGYLWAAAHPRIETDIPFTFQVADKSLPSGHYIFEQRSEYDSAGWAVRSRDGKTKVDFMTSEAVGKTPAKQSTLDFDVIGSKHFLSSLWMQGSMNGRGLATCQEEKALMDKGLKSRKRHVVAGMTHMMHSGSSKRGSKGSHP